MKKKTFNFYTATEIACQYRSKRLEFLQKKHAQELFQAYGILITQLQKQEILPGQYWIEQRFEENKITLIAHLYDPRKKEKN